MKEKTEFEVERAPSLKFYSDFFITYYRLGSNFSGVSPRMESKRLAGAVWVGSKLKNRKSKWILRGQKKEPPKVFGVLSPKKWKTNL